MTLTRALRDFFNYSPPPRNPAVDRFVYYIGVIGTPIELFFDHLNGIDDPVGLFMRYVVFVYSVGALIVSHKTEWGRKNSPVLTFWWLLLVIFQQILQNYLHGFAFDFMVILFMTFPTGALFITSPKRIVAYVGITIVMVLTCLYIVEVTPEDKSRILSLFFYTVLAAIAVFFINYRLAVQLGDATNKFKILADNTTDIIGLHDLGGITQYISPSAECLSGYTVDEFLGKSAFHIIHESDRPYTKEAYGRLFIPPHNPVQLEYRIQRKDGTLVWVEAVGTAVLDEKGQIQQIVTTTRDISRRKLAEYEREAKTAELTRINRELDQFAYVVSHDLKAPLRGIATLTTFIEEDLGKSSVPEEVGKHLVMMRQRTERLERLVNDILAYSRAGRSEAIPELIDTEKFFLELPELVAMPPGFKVELKGEFPQLKATRIYFEQVFSNLLTNAYRHHDQAKGLIEVFCKKEKGGWEFSISDDGPGIPPKYQDRIFEAFSQLAPKDIQKGSGIGLAVVRKVLSQVNGWVKMEPRSPKGTTFRVFWPDEHDRGDDAKNGRIANSSI